MFGLMILGHVFLAFTLVSLAACYVGRERRECLVLGLFAAAFAFLPDVDLLFAWREVLMVFSSGMSGFVDAFWAASRSFHRGISHSLVTLALVFTGFSLYRRYSFRPVALTVFLVLTFYGYLAAGFIVGMVVSVLTLSGLLLTRYSSRFLGVRDFMWVSAVGLFTHPFGDVFTGSPPDFFFPLGFSLLEARVVLHPDPVLNLLSVFFIEVLLVIAGFVSVLLVMDEEVVSTVHPVSGIGLLYAPAFLLLPYPTLTVSYPFVFSVAGFGLFTAALLSAVTGRDRGDLVFLGFNASVTVLLAASTYTAVYVLA